MNQRKSKYAHLSYWSRTLSPRREARRRVLVASSLDDRAAVALRRADALARVMGAELVVLHVVEPPVWFRPLFPQAHLDEMSEVEQRVVLASKATRAWAERVLGQGARVEIVVQVGPVARAILRTATACRASLIVLGGRKPRSWWRPRSSVTSRVFRSSRVPVLVARPERKGGEILAASNLRDTRYPALRQAARLGVRLGTPVTFFHNAEQGEQLVSATLFGLPLSTLALPLPSDVARRKSDLEKVAERIGHDADTLVGTAPSAADAILDVARDRDADLIVVGTRRGDGFAGIPSTGTATAVARRARRSVLAVPAREDVVAAWVS